MPARAFHERVASLRANLGEAMREAADLHLGEAGVRRVGVSPLYAQRMFMPACLALRRERPVARLVVRMGLNASLLVALPFAEARFPRHIGVITRQGASLPLLAQRSVELLQRPA